MTETRMDPPGFACPACRAILERVGDDELRCPAEASVYRRVDGIWRLLCPGRERHFETFVAEYEAVRRAEGRGFDDGAFYLALPFEDRSGRFTDDWRIRAKSFRALLDGAVAPLERRRRRPLRVLDLGAGNGWLAHRLAERGHSAAAVDLLTNTFDGLGAHLRYRSQAVYPAPGAVIPIQAEFDHLPFANDEFDLAVFNGSLHYSTDYGATLRETLRTLRTEGELAILDSPIYRDAASGAQMVREREAHFQRVHGFPSNALPSENYLTHGRLGALGDDLGLRWRTIEPFYGLRWAARPWKARLLRHREPARFLVVVGARREGS